MADERASNTPSTSPLLPPSSSMPSTAVVSTGAATAREAHVLPDPVVCVVAQSFVNDPYHPLLLADPPDAPKDASALQCATRLYMKIQKEGRPAIPPGRLAAAGSVSSAPGGCDGSGDGIAAGSGDTAGGSRKGAAMSRSLQQRQQQSRLLNVAALPFADQAAIVHLGITCGTVGVFHPTRYARGEPCFEVVDGTIPKTAAGGSASGAFVSCSKFEKLGGGRMARWYRSIYIVQPLQKIEDWLKSNNLPVRVGKSRTRRRGIGTGAGAQQGQQAKEQQDQLELSGAASADVQCRPKADAEAEVELSRRRRALTEDESTESDGGVAHQEQVWSPAGKGTSVKRKCLEAAPAGRTSKRQACRQTDDAALPQPLLKPLLQSQQPLSPSQVLSPPLKPPPAPSPPPQPHLEPHSEVQALPLPLPLPHLPSHQLQWRPLQPETPLQPQQQQQQRYGDGPPAWHEMPARQADTCMHQMANTGHLAPGCVRTGDLEPYEQRFHSQHHPEQQLQVQTQHQPQLQPPALPLLPHMHQPQEPRRTAPVAQVPNGHMELGNPFTDRVPRPPPQLQMQQRPQYQHFSGQPQQGPGRAWGAGPSHHGYPGSGSTLAPVPAECADSWSSSALYPPQNAFEQHHMQQQQQQLYYHEHPRHDGQVQHMPPVVQQTYGRLLRGMPSTMCSPWHAEHASGTALGPAEHDTQTPTSAAMPVLADPAVQRSGAGPGQARYRVLYTEPRGAWPPRPPPAAGPEQPGPVYVFIAGADACNSGWAPALPFRHPLEQAVNTPQPAAPPPRQWPERMMSVPAGGGQFNHPPFACHGGMETPLPPPYQRDFRWADSTDWHQVPNGHSASTCSQYPGTAAPGPYPQRQAPWAAQGGYTPYINERQQQQQQPPMPLPPQQQQQQQFTMAMPTGAAAARAEDAEGEELAVLRDILAPALEDIDG